MAQSALAEASTEDPYLWLEEVDGARAVAWVEDHNAAALSVLQNDRRYEGFYRAALEIGESRDRIPAPRFNRAGTIDNFWQDADHVRGVWRRAGVDSFLVGEPEWRTILDMDALAASEEANWVYKSASCLPPEERYCLVSLSDGGKDADVIREYDAVEGRWVQDGFNFPESLGGAVWVDRDTLMVMRDFGTGTTASGNPISVRRLKRGQSLDEGQTVLTVEPTDLAAWSSPIRDADGVVRAVLLTRIIDFYEARMSLLTDDGRTRPLPFPPKKSINGLVGGRLVLTLEQDWTSPGGEDFRMGDLLAYEMDELLTDPMADVHLVFRPGPRQAMRQVAVTRNHVAVALYDNVRGSVRAFRPVEGGGWESISLDLPENVSVFVASASPRDDRILLDVTGYLTPPSLWVGDAASGETQMVRSQPHMFDTEGLIVEQLEARSADGTMIPYFVVRRENAPMDGSNPTILTGYGAFMQWRQPFYDATDGRMWLENGGIFVQSILRGGGEFGPAWHKAAQGRNRQRTHEDFQAVAEDLIARGITSPRRLGVIGGSQGGLLMGTMLTQRPDLINAAVIQVPLFDMMRYHRLGRGALWMSEYGNPDIAEERAWLSEYSPYQRLSADQAYPEVFILTSTKDDRVHPGHARKAAARLEALGHPVLFYENTDGGHAAGANEQETARRLALEYTYLARRLMND